MRTRGLGTAYVSVDVNVEEVLDDVRDADLLEYVQSRFKTGGTPADDFMGLVREAYDALARGDTASASLSLEKALFPRFESVADCLAKYQKAKAVSEVPIQ